MTDSVASNGAKELAQPSVILARPVWMADPRTQAVVAALTGDGTEIRFVGGCVRDAVTGDTPADIDFATPLPPDQVVARLRNAGLRAVPTGIDHGTVTAISGGQPFEITTLREDVETFGRRARVAFTADWQTDAARRDFTFNALSCRPDGAVFDYFNGIADLHAGRVRFVGDPATRIREDVLRILRYFRFHARFGKGEPAEADLAACRELAPLQTTLSGERVRAELFRLLTGRRATAAWRLMVDHQVMAPLLPAATDTDRLARLRSAERAAGWPVAMPAVLRLAALLRGEGPIAVAAATAERLRLSNRERDRLLVLAEPPVAIGPADDPAVLRRALVRLRDPTLFLDLVLLAAAGVDRSWQKADFAAAATAADLWRSVRFPLSGRDLLAAGVPAGPAIRQLLTALEAWWADRGFLPDRPACLVEMHHRLAPTEPPPSPASSSPAS